MGYPLWVRQRLPDKKRCTELFDLSSDLRAGAAILGWETNSFTVSTCHRMLDGWIVLESAMYETEVNHKVETSSQIPGDVISALAESKDKILARTVLPWSEHCTECVWPTCYTT